MAVPHGCMCTCHMLVYSLCIYIHVHVQVPDESEACTCHCCVSLSIDTKIPLSKHEVLQSDSVPVRYGTKKYTYMYIQCS